MNVELTKFSKGDNMSHVHVITRTVLNSEDKFGNAGTVRVRRGDMFVIGGIILYNEKTDTVDIPIADGSYFRNVSLGLVELLGSPEVHVVEEEKVHNSFSHAADDLEVDDDTE